MGGYPKGGLLEIVLVFRYDNRCSRSGSKLKRRRHVGAFIDAEHALDPSYAAALGVSIDELLLSQPDSEQGLKLQEN